MGASDGGVVAGDVCVKKIGGEEPSPTPPLPHLSVNDPIANACVGSAHQTKEVQSMIATRKKHRKATQFATLALAAWTLGAPAAAYAGCATGAAVGGVAGHVAGHHALLGAAAGCAIGHHRAVEQRKAAAAQAAQPAPAPAPPAGAPH